MPETYGLPEPEEPLMPRIETAIAEAVAGQGIVRRVVLYCLTVGAAVTASVGGLIGLIAVVLALIAVVLLMATDKGLA